MTCKSGDLAKLPAERFCEIKYDGHRATMHITKLGNFLFSRRESKVTGWLSENSDCMPHLRDFKFPFLTGYTVLDGEIVMPTGVFADVQSVTGSLPDHAVKVQEEKGQAIFRAFDIIFYNGEDVQNRPLIERKTYLNLVINSANFPFLKESPIYCEPETYEYLKPWYSKLPLHFIEDIPSFLQEVQEEGKEGLIVKDFRAKYEQKRSKHFLKFKGEITKDVVIMGYQPPTKEYDGKTELKDWKYWEDKLPVTKPYAMGWIGAIEVGIYKKGKLVKVAEVKGITDEDQEYIKANREALIGTVIEVKAQEIISESTGSLRHPRFSRWRKDKDSSMCTWEDYIDG